MTKQPHSTNRMTLVVTVLIAILFVFHCSYFISSIADLLDNTAILDPDELRTSALKITKSFVFLTLLLVFFQFTWMFFARYLDTLVLTRNRKLLDSERQRYKVALQNSDNSIWEYFPADDQLIWDESNYTKEAFLDVSCSKRKELVSGNIIHPDDHMNFLRFCDSLLNSEPSVRVELRAKNADGGSYIWYELMGTKIFETDGFPVSVIGRTTNINKQKLEFLELSEKASQDSLTRLYNYTAFTERVNKRIREMDEPTILALLLIDIDNFTGLNDAFGYVFADACLIEIAGRLRKLFADSSLLGRYGADEFILLLDHVPSVSYVEEMAQNILNSFQNIYTGTNTKHSLTGSIGISIFPVDDNNYEGLFSKADIALYDAKHRGKGRYCVYNEKMADIPEAIRYRKFAKQNVLNSHIEERTLIDSNIIANAIDILFDSKDISVSINMMLSLVGIYYNLDHLFIEEYSDDNTANVSYEWTIDSKYALPKQVRSDAVDKNSLLSEYQNASEGFFYCEDIRLLSVEPDIFHQKTTALVQCGIHYLTTYIGCINICTCDKPRVWSRRELDSLVLLSKLIGSYVLHLQSQEKIDYVSQMDSLTNTYNFNAFITNANEILSNNPSKKYAAVYSDIYQFKLINDNYGYQAGDHILKELSTILLSAGEADSDSLVARITGDKFVAMYRYESLEELTERMKAIIYESKRIRQSNGDFYRLIVTIGIYPIELGDSAIVAVDRANIARKNVVDYHICNYCYYNETMHNTLMEQKDIEDSMESALRNHEFIVYYQPKFNTVTKKAIGVEALVRWLRPNKEIVPPIRFVPLFEENGFIIALDYYVLDSVCCSLRTLLDRNVTVLPVSVNFSRIHFNSNMLPTVLRSTLDRYSIPPSLIEVEITESALGNNDMFQLSILNEIHDIGCRLSMDDFGSGMSSLNILRDLPFDILKIDKDFLHSKSTTLREQIVITNVVRMAQNLNMDIICEGVESEAQEEFLHRIGCHNAQGYLYAVPMPEEEYISNYLEGANNA